MKILFTGGSSFTGYWFIRELTARGHQVFATYTQSSADHYDDIRAQRVKESVQACTPIWNCSFGDDRFIQLIQEQDNWDLYCHHGAYVHDYKSLDFDVAAAMQANTNNLSKVLMALKSSSCDQLLLTGSVFEQREGIGDPPLSAFSPYGLSKGLSAEIFRHRCQQLGIGLSKFVIPNPFGPFEEKRFTAYLINNWLDSKIPSVNTPDYVRDNIHVELLAKTYSQFATEIVDGTDRTQLNPCGYIESQGAFTERLAAAMRPRLSKPCAFELLEQKVFDEPRIRVNFDKQYMDSIIWDEQDAWNAMADYYLISKQR